MVLVDTSVWVDHLRTGEAKLTALLQAGLVCCHPMVVGELACGNLKNRNTVLGLLQDLEQAVEANHDEVLQVIDRFGLMGQGIGFVDVHLLASCLLTTDAKLWTRDKRLGTMAHSMGLGYVDVS